MLNKNHQVNLNKSPNTKDHTDRSDKCYKQVSFVFFPRSNHPKGCVALGPQILPHKRYANQKNISLKF